MNACFFCNSSAIYASNVESKCPEIVLSSTENEKEIKFFQPETFEIDVKYKETILNNIENPQLDDFIRKNYSPIDLQAHFVIFKRKKNYKFIEQSWCKVCFEFYIEKKMHNDLIKRKKSSSYKISENPKVLDMKLVDDFVDCMDCKIEIHGVCYSCDETPNEYLCRECFYKAREKFGIRFLMIFHLPIHETEMLS